jgi:hypothetical protein
MQRAASRRTGGGDDAFAADAGPKRTAAVGFSNAAGKTGRRLRVVGGYRGGSDIERTRWLLFLIGLLALAGAGYARRDWVSDLLVLTDVTGTWEGWVNNAVHGAHSQAIGNLLPRTAITVVLQQKGPKVTGELSWERGQGRVEGLVNGEVLTWNVGIRAELAVMVTRCGVGPKIVFSPVLVMWPVDPAFSASGV